jgi:type II secretory pathway pseudopilin PulG
LRRKDEHGYVLIGILFMVTLMVVMLAVAVPMMRTQIKRDREEELIRRGRQYQRAIQLYYRKFGQYPSSVEQLENTNNIRFLRRKYTDPITGKDEWKFIRLGQQRARTRPRYLSGGTNMAGANPAGTSAQTPKPQAGISNAGDISRPLSGSKTMGGGPIVGVASTSEKEAVKEIDGLTKHNEWEFVYDPTLDPNARQVPNQNQGGRNPQGNRTNQPSNSPTPPQPQDRR